MNTDVENETGDLLMNVFLSIYGLLINAGIHSL